MTSELSQPARPVSDRPEDHLAPGTYIDSDHPAVREFARRASEGTGDPIDAAIRLYRAVRDGVRYDPYRMDLSPDGLKASRCLETGYGFCVPKAALLAAAARAIGIPARVGYADVRNHLTSARLRATLGTDLFVFHGYTELFLDGRWVKATPAFNLSLCEKAGIRPIEFDGRSDSVMHPFDLSGRQHMEYVNDHGSFGDVPRERLIAAWTAVYPDVDQWSGSATPTGDFEREVDRPG